MRDLGNGSIRLFVSSCVNRVPTASIALAEKLVGGRMNHAGSDRQRMIRAQRPFGLHGCANRCLKMFGQLLQFVARTAQNDPAAGPDERTAGIHQQVECTFNLFGRRAQGIAIRGSGNCNLGICIEDVTRNLNRDRARTPIPHASERLMQNIGNRLHGVGAIAPRSHGAEAGQLIAALVDVALFFADPVGWNLACDTEHR